MTPQKRSKLLKLFSELYPDPKSELNFRSSYQLIVAVMLSAQCTDKKVNQVTPDLFREYTSFQKLAAARVSSIEKIIRPINYYKTKSKNLIAMAKRVINDFSGKLPRNHEELCSLAGVGRKTANVVLSELGITPTLPVDTHVFRVSRRLGLSSGKTPEKTEDELRALFKPEYWRPLHHWLILHGRRVCKAQRPRCDECELKRLCPSRE